MPNDTEYYGYKWIEFHQFQKSFNLNPFRCVLAISLKMYPSLNFSLFFCLTLFLLNGTEIILNYIFFLLETKHNWWWKMLLKNGTKVQWFCFVRFFTRPKKLSNSCGFGFGNENKFKFNFRSVSVNKIEQMLYRIIANTTSITSKYHFILILKFHNLV